LPPSVNARCFFVKLAASGKGLRLQQFHQSDSVSLNAQRVRALQTHMASSQLPNYLRSNRKRLALSQDEVAFLLGTKSGAKVSRYERFDREPGIETALALEVIYQRSASELFDGLYQKVERKVIERAKILAGRTNQRKSKRQIFTNIANKSFN
jgi:transcriptional regulator with XRE-family HTH domain